MADSKKVVPIADDIVLARIRSIKPTVVAALLRVGRRIEEGFEGEITIAIKQGGVHYIRWVQTETGETIREELL